MNRLGKEHLAGVSEEGDRVRARRERLGMSKSDLAAEAKVNRNTLAAIEAGESFNRTTLAKIERALTSSARCAEERPTRGRNPSVTPALSTPIGNATKGP